MEIVRHPELEALLRAGYGDRLHERDLRMADIPSGARLEYGPGGPGGDARAPWPVVVVRNVWVLPGVPSIFRRKFEAVRELFRAGPIHGRALFSRAGEGHIAGALDEAVAAFPGRRDRVVSPPRGARLPRQDHARRAGRRAASTTRWPGWPRGWATAVRRATEITTVRRATIQNVVKRRAWRTSHPASRA